jgi:hypothetical protein
VIEYDAAALSIEKAMLHLQLLEKERLEEQMKTAREVQSRLLPVEAMIREIIQGTQALTGSDIYPDDFTWSFCGVVQVNNSHKKGIPTMPTTINEKLDHLANYQAEREVLQLQKQELIDEILTAEIKARLDEIEAEFAPRMVAVDENIAALEEEIKADVLQNGATVRGTFLRAVWNRGRVSWDTKGIDEYALYHPEVIRYRKQGQPYVSITRVEAK